MLLPNLLTLYYNIVNLELFTNSVQSNSWAIVGQLHMYKEYCKFKTLWSPSLIVVSCLVYSMN